MSTAQVMAIEEQQLQLTPSPAKPSRSIHNTANQIKQGESRGMRQRIHVTEQNNMDHDSTNLSETAPGTGSNPHQWVDYPLSRRSRGRGDYINERAVKQSSSQAVKQASDVLTFSSFVLGASSSCRPSVKLTSSLSKDSHATASASDFPPDSLATSSTCARPRSRHGGSGGDAPR